LGVIVYYQRGNLIFRSHLLGDGIEPYLDLIKRSIRADRPQEEFGAYQKVPLFSYSFPLQDSSGNKFGGVSILQPTSYVDQEIEKAKWNILVTILLLIGGTVALVLWGTKKWVNQPISTLMEGIRSLAKGNFDQKIILQRRDELSELAGAFNQMAADLKAAREKIVREAEAKLELERGLRQSEKLATLGQLASGLAHEVGTPLNIIYGRAEFIQRKPEDKEGIQKNAGIILNQTERITRIIQQFLGVVRKKKTEYAALNPNSLLETALDLLEYQIQRQGVTVIKDWKDPLLSVKGDPDHLQQVFLNLLLNAIQSMPEGGTLRLSTSSKEIAREGSENEKRRYAEVRVEDAGVGMEKEVLQSLFTPFFTTKTAGTGLGLMVSEGIVRDHEGWIEVESEPGKGSVFKVYLPELPAEVKDGGTQP
jgi:signal transduction histidine kinase